MEDNELLKALLLLGIAAVQECASEKDVYQNMSPELLNFKKAVTLEEFAQEVYIVLKDEFIGDVRIDGNTIFMDIENNKFTLEVREYA